MDFYNTVMGRRFYEGTMPSIAKSLEIIAAHLNQSGTQSGQTAMNQARTLLVEAESHIQCNCGNQCQGTCLKARINTFLRYTKE